jgi:hypothetical protein
MDAAAGAAQRPGCDLEQNDRHHAIACGTDKGHGGWEGVVEFICV